MQKIGTNRRSFMIGSAGLAAATALGTGCVRASGQMELPDYVEWKDSDDLIIHSERTIETRRDAIGSGGITPSEDLYVRNNLATPSPSVLKDRDSWTVSFEGVGNPQSLTLSDLKAIGITSVATVLQCSGNGRGFFAHETSGTQWTVGAAGCVMWTGVPLKDVIAKLGGAADGMIYLTGLGGEEIPAGLENIRVERSIPIKALDRAILAWEMNDQPLELAHGGPLRLVVPGYYGVNNVKYIKKIAFTKEQSSAKIQQTSYRVRPVGEKGAPDQPSMYEMSVKSWITAPLSFGDTDAGMAQITGVAFGGGNSAAKIEVSVDGGKSWQEAEFLGPDLGPYAWRPFALITKVEKGAVIASRATDSLGNTQPEDFPGNERGYGHNGWRAHSVKLS